FGCMQTAIRARWRLELDRRSGPPGFRLPIDQAGRGQVLDRVAHRLVDGDLVVGPRPGRLPSKTSPISLAFSGSIPASSMQPAGGALNAAARDSTNRFAASASARSSSPCGAE